VTVERIVVGVDGSEGARKALGWTIDLAAVLDSEILAVYVVPQSWLFTLSAFQLKTDELVTDLRAKLIGEWTEPLRTAGVRHSTEFLHGDPGGELLRIADARDADLIVIGGTHRGSLRHTLMGGTAHHVVNRSDVPVLVVPAFVEGTEDEWVPIPG
jgi:nucleotide-binding universal stress UspA family protein